MSRSRRSWPLLVILLCGGVVMAAGAPRAWRAGRPLAEALQALRDGGLEVIYSSDLVRPGMRVLAEPIGTSPREILVDLIAPHGLAARDGPGGTLVVVRDESIAGPHGGISGRVVAAETRAPSAGARLSVAGAQVETTAAADGRFLIPILPPGEWILEARSADGRASQSAPVLVRDGALTPVVLGLSESPALIEGIVVTPTRYRILSGEPEPRRTIEPGELARLAWMGDDALRAIGKLPGAVATDKSAQSFIRGGEWNETSIVLDGLEIDQPFHFEDLQAHNGIIDSRAIGRIDLMTGGFPVEYGGRMSGVIDLTSLAPVSPGSTSLGTGIPSSWAMNLGRTPGGGAGWLAAARAWYPVTLKEGVDPGGEDLNPYYYDLLGKYEIGLGSATRISAHVLAARGSVDFTSAPAEEAVRARFDTAYAWVNFRTIWTQRLTSVSQISTGSVEAKRRGDATDDLEETSKVDEERDASFVGARQDWSFAPSDRLVLKWGFDARRSGAEYDYAGRAAIADPIYVPAGTVRVVNRNALSSRSGTRMALYAAARVSLLPSLTAEAGARWSRQTYAFDAQVDPRVNLVWAAGPATTLRAAWGIFHQSQRIDEMQVEDGVHDFLPAQAAEHRELSVEQAIAGGYAFRASAYWKRMTHLRPRFENQFNPIELIPELDSDRIEVAPSRAAARGIEVYLRRDAAGPVSWWAGYALSKADDVMGGRRVPRSWDQRHALNGGAAFRPGGGWEIGLTASAHTGWPTTRVTATSAVDPNGAVVIEPTLGPRNEDRFPSYLRFDLRIARSTTLGGGVLTASIDLLNATNHRNVCCVDEFEFEPRSGGRVEVNREQDTWLERLPVFGIAWEF